MAGAQLDLLSSEGELRNARRNYLVEHDSSTAKANYLDILKHDLHTSLPAFHLALLAEKERNWSEATHWMHEFLQREPTGELAEKVRKELVYLRWVVLFEQTPEGADHRRSLDRLAEARAAYARQEWLPAGTKAYEAIFADAANYEAHFLAAAAAEKMQRFDVAEAILTNGRLHAPSERHKDIDEALARCRRMMAFGENKIAGDKSFGAGKRSEAADSYFKAWEAAPERYDAALSAVQSAVIGEDYPKARLILTKLETAGAPPDAMPTGLRNIPDLLERLDRLQASVPAKARSGSTKSSATSANKARSNKGSKKTMANDFLSRIKK